MKQGRNCRQLLVNALENVIEEIHEATSSPAAGKQSLLLQKQLFYPNLWHFIIKRCAKPADQTGIAQGFLVMENICFRTNKLEALTWNKAKLANQNSTNQIVALPKCDWERFVQSPSSFCTNVASFPDGHTTCGQRFWRHSIWVACYFPAMGEMSRTPEIHFPTKLKADLSTCKLSTCEHKVSWELFFSPLLFPAHQSNDNIVCVICSCGKSAYSQALLLGERLRD